MASGSFVVEVGVHVSAGILRGVLDIKAGILELGILGKGAVTVVIGDDGFSIRTYK